MFIGGDFGYGELWFNYVLSVDVGFLTGRVLRFWCDVLGIYFLNFFFRVVRFRRLVGVGLILGVCVDGLCG